MALFDFLKRKPSIPPEALTIAVQRLSAFECLQHTAREAGRDFRFLPLGGLFGVTPALRTTDDLVFVNEQHLAALQLDFAAALSRGSANVGVQLREVEVSDGLVLWEVPGAEALVLSAPLFLPHLPLKGAPVLLVPCEGVALMTGADDHAALERMLSLAERLYDRSERFLSLRPLTWPERDQLPVEWSPPASHPLRARVRRLAAKTLRHEAQQLHGVFGGDSPLAHLAPLERNGGGLLASWMRDADVVLPREVDRVLLLDTDDAPLSRVEVPLATLLEEFAPLFAPVWPDTSDDDAPLSGARLLRTRGTLFPSVTERRFLVQRAAFELQSPGATTREVPGAELLALFDAGEPVLAEAIVEVADQVLLRSADRRTARVSVTEFGARIERRPLDEQLRFHQSFSIAAMLRALIADDAPPPYELPEGLEERASRARPVLLSSNDVRRLLRFEEGESDAVRTLMTHTLSTWEPARLMPLVRPPRYDEGDLANVQGMALGLGMSSVEGFTHVRRPAPEGLALELVSDHGDRVQVINGSTLGPELVEAAWRSGLLNLDGASQLPLSESSPGVFVGPWHDDFDFSRVLLLPRLISACRVKGAPLVFAPLVGRVWLTGSADEAGLRTVLDELEAHLASDVTRSPYEFRQLLFATPWTLRDGALVRAAVPASIAARVQALDAQLERRREQSRQHVGAFAQSVSRRASTELS
ncbi:MAG: hypothetical protein ACOZQL_10010 [Myxococcota bacterium]